MKKLKEIMSKDVAFATPDTSLTDIAELMVTINCGEIPIVKSKKQKNLVGVITDRDIVCRTMGVGKNPMKLFARDCMTTHVITASVSSSLTDCVHLMRDNKIRRIPVLDENKELCGIVSLADIVGKADVDETMEMIEEVSHGETPSAVH